MALAAATAAGALLFAISASGVVDLPTLLRTVALPSAIALAVLLIAAVAMHYRRLAVGIAVGFWTGLVATLGLELIREGGFRLFHSMPGDITTLMGVKITGTIMQGPTPASNIAGWSFHFWNGAMFGVTFALLVGGFPQRRGRAAAAAGIGAVYGLMLGTGFLLSPVTIITGAGVFRTTFGPAFAITVYLAHALFGAILGLLVHRFTYAIDPLWVVVIRCAASVFGHRPAPQAHATDPAGSPHPAEP